MLILNPTRKSLIEPCCGGCANGKKQCCGQKKHASRKFAHPALQPSYERRGGLWLPRKELVTPKSLLGHPSQLEWPGGRFWPGLPMQSRQYDMNCTGCCEGMCCHPGPECVLATFSSELCPDLDGCQIELIGGTDGTNGVWNFEGGVQGSTTCAFFDTNFVTLNCAGNDPDAWDQSGEVCDPNTGAWEGAADFVSCDPFLVTVTDESFTSYPDCICQPEDPDVRFSITFIECP